MYKEVDPRPLEIDELQTLHGFAVSLGSELTSDLIMEGYWLRRDSQCSSEELPAVTLTMSMYDKDWECLTQADINPRDEAYDLDDDWCLPTLTYLKPKVLVTDREEYKALTIERAQAELLELQLGFSEHITEAIDKIGLDDVNKLLRMIGAVSNEHGEVIFIEVAPEQVEGVRKVARVMSEVWKDTLRMNRGVFALVFANDIEVIEGTNIENSETDLYYRALLGRLGLED